MQPEPPGGGSIPREYLIAGGLVVLVAIWYIRKNASASSSATNSSTPYGQPATGTGVLEPILINTGAGSSSATINNPPSPGVGDLPSVGPINKTVPSPFPANQPGNTFTQQQLDTYVGQFSSGWKLKTPTASMLNAYKQSHPGITSMQLQAWNVGELTSLNHLSTPSVSQIKALAIKNNPNFSKLDSNSQNIELERANVQLLEQMNKPR